MIGSRFGLPLECRRCGDAPEVILGFTFHSWPMIELACGRCSAGVERWLLGLLGVADLVGEPLEAA